MQSFFSFLKSKQFFIHLGIILVLIVSLLFGVVTWTTYYTQHNEFITVPDFKTKKISDLDSFVSGKEVMYEIIDSIYDPKEKAGIVLRQDPEADSKVKHNRTVYLYVTGMVAPQIQMPKLIDRSERQAKLIIETYGLKIGHVSETEADCNGCVVAQLVKGRNVAPGESVKKGSVVNLVIGRKGSSLETETQNDETNKND